MFLAPTADRYLLGRRNDESFHDVDDVVVIPEDWCDGDGDGDGDDDDACDIEIRLAALDERLSRRGECDDDPENFEQSSSSSSSSS